MTAESLGNSPICVRCRFWQMEPGALTQAQIDTLRSIPDTTNLELKENAKSFLSAYGKCLATYNRGLVLLKGTLRTEKLGSLYGNGTTALSICESTDNHGRILFNEIQID